MDRRLAPVLGLLLVASFYSFVSGPTSGNAPSSSEAVRSSRPPGTKSAPAGGTTAELPSSAKLVPRSELGPWQAACDFFLHQGDRSPAVPIDLLRPTSNQLTEIARNTNLGEPPLPGGQTPSAALGVALKRRWCFDRSQHKDFHLNFLIATVPDPVHTHLALDFDRRIEAIQWAAMDIGYVGDRFWLPWDSGAPADFADADQQRAEIMLREVRARQPGLQIFRGKDAALFVFFVAETPTSGMNKAQLQNALDYIQQIVPEGEGPPSPLPVLGPSFSGSVRSLREGLWQYASSQTKKFRVITSSATDEDSLTLLADAPPNSGISFETVLHTDKFALDKFLKSYVSDNLHLGNCDVAMLSESETAYGGAFQERKDAHGEPESDHQPCNQPISANNILHFRFPRDISHLRTVYPDQPAPQPAPGNAAVPRGLPFDLKQVLGGEDDLPPFSMSQLPLSQESELLDLAFTLRQRRVKLVGIGATDIFDILFISRFLKQYSPDTRLFVLDADVLLARATETLPLEGTLVVTTYPMVAANQEWSYPQSTGDADCPTGSLHLQFPSFFSEGTYNAFLALMGHPGCLRDYGWPGGPISLSEPPLWVSVVGRNGYWPLTILPPGTDPSARERIHFAAEGMQYDCNWPGNGRLPALALPERGFQYEFPGGAYLLLCGLLVSLSFLHAFMGLLKNKGPYSFLRAAQESFVLEETGTQRAQKAYFFATQLLVLVVADLIVFLPLWAAARRDHPWFHSLFSLLCAAALLSALGASLLTLRECLRSASPEERWFSDPRRMIWASVLIAVLFSLSWLSLAWNGSAGVLAGSFFLYRGPELASGVSPLVPCLLLMIPVYFWCWVQIRRVRSWEWRRPLLPVEAMDELYGCGFAKSQNELDHVLRSAIPPSGSVKFVLVAALASPILLRPWRQVASLEVLSRLNLHFFGFDFLYLLLLTLLYALIFAGWTRLLSVWSSLRAILLGLERPLLRRAFARLPKEFDSMMLLWNNPGKRNFARVRRSLECLQKLCHDPGAASLQQLPFYCDKLQASMQELWPAALKEKDLSWRVEHFQQTLHETSNYLLRDLLVPYWTSTGASDSLDEPADASSAPRASSQRYVVRGEEPHEPPDHIVMAEEFVARRFVTMIRYVFLQMGNLLSFLILAFVLSVASLRSYPFLGHHTIGWTLTLISLMLGGGIVKVFAEMDRDSILSRLGNTAPGKLGRDFYVRVISYGALPVLTVLASQFPSIGRFLFSWVQPGLEAMK